MDLTLELENFLLKGNKIILMLDGNSNMKNSDLSRALCKLSLYEAILSKHGLDGPATHKRNATKSPVDGIWMSPGLEILKRGLLRVRRSDTFRPSMPVDRPDLYICLRA